MAEHSLEIAANIVTRADNQQLLSDVGQAANSMARIIEDAMQGIGEKIAQAIVGGLKKGADQAKGIYVDPNTFVSFAGGQQTAQAQPLTGPIAGAPQAPQPSTNPFQGFGGSGARGTAGAFPYYADPFLTPNMVAQGGDFNVDLQHMLKRQEYGSGAFEAAQTDASYQQAKIIQNMRQAGMATPLNADQREAFGNARGVAVENLRRIEEQAAELVKGLKENSQKLSGLEEQFKTSNTLTDEEQKTLKQNIDTTRHSIQRQEEEIARKATTSGALAQQVDTFSELQRGGGFDFARAAGPMTIIGQAMQTAGQLPGALRRSAAAGAETDNLGARQLLRGDLESNMALEQIGGQNQARTRARMEEGISLGGEALSAIGLALLAPMTGGLSLLGALPMAGKTAMGIAGFNQSVQQNIEGQIGSQMGQNSEFFQFTQAGRQNAVGGFRAAQAMGAPEMSQYLTGVGPNLGLLRQQLRSEEQRTDVGMGSFIGSRDEDSPYQMRRNMTEQERAQRSANITGLRGQISSGEMMQTSLGGSPMDLMSFGVNQANLSTEQVQQTLRSLAGGMGGAFLGQTPELMRNPDISARVMRMQGQGLANAPELATGLFERGDTRAGSSERLQQIFEDAVSAGLDKAATGRAIVTAMSSATGLGSGTAIQEQMNTALGLAQKSFGMNINGPEMGFVQQGLNRIDEGAKGEGGVQAIGGLRGVRSFARNNQFKFSAVQENQLQQLTADPEGLQSFIKRTQGRDISIEEATRMTEELQQSKRAGTLSADVQAYGPEAGQRAFEKQFGVNTLKESELARGIGRNLRTGKGGAMPDTGADIDTTTWQITHPRAAQIQADADKAQGADQAKALAQIDATKISAGLNTLGEQLGLVNNSLKALVTRAETVLAEHAGRGSAGAAFRVGPAAGAVNSIDSYLTGGGQSSHMPARPRGP